MSLSNYRCFLALFVCGAVMFMIVDGQPTTDDEFDKDEISKLIDTVEELRAEQAVSAGAITDLKSQLAGSRDEIANLKAKGKGKISSSATCCTRVVSHDLIVADSLAWGNHTVVVAIFALRA